LKIFSNTRSIRIPTKQKQQYNTKIKEKKEKKKRRPPLLQIAYQGFPQSGKHFVNGEFLN
jgi:hypothetical protein